MRKSKARLRKGRRRDKLKEGQRQFIDRDRLNFASKDEVAKGTVLAFAALQKKPREVQLLALASAFVLMSEALRFPTSDTYTAVTNLMRDPLNATRREARFDAMRFHIETELDAGGTNFAPADEP